MADQKEARESHELFRAASSLYARCTGNGEVVETEGLCIANSRSAWFIMNAATLGKPVSSPAELAARANEAMAYFANEQHPWFFIGSKEWLGEGSSETLSRLGLTESFSVTGMVAEQLAPPSRPLPEVETRRIDDESGRLALSDLNAVTYDLPADWVRGMVAGPSIWQTPLYVAFVATAAAHRRRGLAELVMRRCLEKATEETGITRTVLHATADGYPSYLRMGYRPVDEFSIYVPA